MKTIYREEVNSGYYRASLDDKAQGSFLGMSPSLLWRC